MKTNLFKSFLLALIAAMIPQLASAYDFMVDGIAYNYNNDGTSVTVTSGGNYVEAVIIPENVTYDGSTFSVTSIGNKAFSGCTGLTSVTIGNSVTTIGNQAFYGCSGLTSVTIPNSVISIGNYAFSYCTDLTSLTIPSSLIAIGYQAFDGCSGLTSVNISDLTAWCNIDFGDLFSNPLYYAHDLYLNDSKITDLVIPNSITAIKNYTFSGCSDLTSVTIPNSVTSIGQAVFYGCTGLTSVTIPNSVISIGNSAFYYCTGLTSVNISDIASWCNIDFGGYSVGGYSNNPLFYAHNLYLNGSIITDLVIPNEVSEIKSCTFYSCTGLTSVTIGNSVTSIGQAAFSGCTGLTSVNIGNSVTSIGNQAFYNCYALSSVTIPNSVTSIGGGAFYGCSGLTSVNIGNSVTTIGNQAFYKCSWLTQVTIPNSVTEIGEEAFMDCHLTSVVIPNSVISIGGRAFSSNSSSHWQKVEWNVKARNSIISSNPPFYQQNGNLQIDTLLIGNEVEVIPEHLFVVTGQRGRLVISNIIIPNTVTSVETNAFLGQKGVYLSALALTGKGEWIINSENYPGLTSLTKFKTVNVGSEITSLGDFNYTPNYVNCYAAVPPICHEGTFANYDGELHVPVESVAAYSTADYWQNFTNRINDLTAKVTLDQSTASIMKNNTLSLTATSIPEGENIKWSTTNSSVATVSDDGVVTAVGVGECDIFASLESNYAVYASCHIDVSGLNGDVDGDGHVTSVDITALYNWLLNGDNSDIVTGDQDGDGTITSVDITVIYNILLGN